MRILKEDTIALLIDIQERLVPAMHDAQATVSASAKLLRGLRILDVPVIAARQYPKGLGDLVPEIRDALHEYTPSDKLSFSAMGSEEIIERMRASGKKNAIVFGMEAHVCVLQTVVDLIAHGYNVVLVADCITSRKPFDCEMALRRAETEGAVLTTMESILFEMLGAAGTDQFKQISALIK